MYSIIVIIKLSHISPVHVRLVLLTQSYHFDITPCVLRDEDEIPEDIMQKYIDS